MSNISRSFPGEISVTESDLEHHVGNKKDFSYRSRSIDCDFKMSPICFLSQISYLDSNVEHLVGLEGRLENRIALRTLN